jgi:hypothetical protein
MHCAVNCSHPPQTLPPKSLISQSTPPTFFPFSAKSFSQSSSNCLRAPSCAPALHLQPRHATLFRLVLSASNVRILSFSLFFFNFNCLLREFLLCFPSLLLWPLILQDHFCCSKNQILGFRIFNSCFQRIQRKKLYKRGSERPVALFSCSFVPYFCTVIPHYLCFQSDLSLSRRRCETVVRLLLPCLAYPRLLWG